MAHDSENTELLAAKLTLLALGVSGTDALGTGRFLLNTNEVSAADAAQLLMAKPKPVICWREEGLTQTEIRCLEADEDSDLLFAAEHQAAALESRGRSIIEASGIESNTSGGTSSLVLVQVEGRSIEIPLYSLVTWSREYVFSDPFTITMLEPTPTQIAKRIKVVVNLSSANSD